MLNLLSNLKPPSLLRSSLPVSPTIQTQTTNRHHPVTFSPRGTRMTTSSNTKTYTYTRYPPSISPSIPRLDTEEDIKKAVLANPETTFDDTIDTTGGWYQKEMGGKVLAIVSDQMCEELDARRDHAEAWVKENERREAAGEPPLEPVCWRR